MNRSLLVFITALAVSDAYTVGKYTNSSCTVQPTGSGPVTVATDGCATTSPAPPASTAATSIKLPNNNCPLTGFFWVNEYPSTDCSGTAVGPIQFQNSVCGAIGTNWFKIVCSVTDNTTTTTEMPFGLPWWFWLLLYCLCCCCLALCGGGGAIPFLGGKKKPTKKPAPVSTPSVVEEVITVEDEAAPMVTAGYPTASMAVPMATTGYAGYPTASMAVPMASYPQAY